ncbi:AAA family ATPase [Peribacillus sp. NPDC096448]|uniref:AAA family ATPase n=1 Tax=Peribacillus sp. NPDC096448 TaxID=3364395 RepID=UPI00381350BD
MFPQLLYVYIKNLRTCFNQQEFCFTNDFEITFNKNNLIISKKKNPYIGLWGEKISNINLIVGKNGSGKTTLLDLLGSTKSRRLNLLKKSKKENPEEKNFEEWFAVYHIEEDTYVIEGFNPHLIENLVNIPLGISDEYSICIKYNFKQEIATYFDYIQMNGYSENTENNTLNRKMVSLYLTNNRDRDWFFGNLIREEQDNYIGFQRMYLNNPQFSNIYTFMSKEYKIIEQSFTAKNALCELKRQTVIDYFEKEEIIESFDLKLYKDKNKILLFQNNFKFDFPKKRKKKKIEEWTTKESFTIKFLESMIIDIWVNLGREELDNKECLECISNIDSILFENDSLENRTNYLLQVLQMILDALNPKLLPERPIYNLFFIREFINILDEIDDSYFISDSSLSIRLSEGYEGRIHDLLTLCDRYVLNKYEMNYNIDIKFKNMSAGELELVNGFSNLYTAIQISMYNKEVNSVLLLLDEPDASFHPEWARRYIYNISKILNEVDYGRKLKYQILITTHSPFIVSDVPKNHITCINIIEDNSGNLQRIVKKADFGLMSNFYDIIQNDFFITSPIGEYARDIFDKIVQKINKWTEYDEQEIEQVNSIISSIGEEMIRVKLQQLLNERKLELLPEKLRNKRINELEIELNKLKYMQGEDIND